MHGEAGPQAQRDVGFRSVMDLAAKLLLRQCSRLRRRSAEKASASSAGPCGTRVVGDAEVAVADRLRTSSACSAMNTRTFLDGFHLCCPVAPGLGCFARHHLRIARASEPPMDHETVIGAGCTPADAGARLRGRHAFIFACSSGDEPPPSFRVAAADDCDVDGDIALPSLRGATSGAMGQPSPPSGAVASCRRNRCRRRRLRADVLASPLRACHFAGMISGSAFDMPDRPDGASLQFYSFRIGYRHSYEMPRSAHGYGNFRSSWQMYPTARTNAFDARSAPRSAL